MRGGVRVRRGVWRRGLASLVAVLLATCVFVLGGCSEHAQQVAPQAEEPAVEAEATGVAADDEGDEPAAEIEAEDAVEDSEAEATRAAPRSNAKNQGGDMWLPEEGSYFSKDEVAWYLHTYGHLPDNYVTKREAQDAGWKNGLSLQEACPGCAIGGDRFGNYEHRLPDARGRVWYECDVNKLRGAMRIVYSNDGLIYYTSDHYNSFVRLY